jgi:predicted DsbA family dithiol-disulfide isomerase
LFGGSFSFINFNQFVQLMRNVAGNAAGYAFQLAVGAMCPWCASVMTDLQKKIQEMNQMFSNSCRLAQGLVNDTVKALTETLNRLTRQADNKIDMKMRAGVTSKKRDVFKKLRDILTSTDVRAHFRIKGLNPDLKL